MRLLLLALALSLAAATPSQAASDDTPCVATSTAELPPFTIRIAATSAPTTALRLARAVKGAWIATYCNSGKTIYRVNYGRFDSRSEALEAQSDVEVIVEKMASVAVQDAGHVVRY